MAQFNPNDVTVDDFKAYFDRAFPFAPDTDPDNKEYIRDVDIQVAFQQAKVNFNSSIWSDYDSAKIAYLFLTAHYLCMDMRMAQSGLASSGAFTMSSKSVGDVSASYAIPQAYLDSPALNYLTSTEFGLKYLSLLYPRTIGSVNVVLGTTTVR